MPQLNIPQIKKFTPLCKEVELWLWMQWCKITLYVPFRYSTAVHVAKLVITAAHHLHFSENQVYRIRHGANGVTRTIQISTVQLTTIGSDLVFFCCCSTSGPAFLSVLFSELLLPAPSASSSSSDEFSLPLLSFFWPPCFFNCFFLAFSFCLFNLEDKNVMAAGEILYGNRGEELIWHLFFAVLSCASISLSLSFS